MKNICIIISLLLIIVKIFSQTQITLTFQAKDSLTQDPLSLDSITILNLTENCDTTLYDSVSVLTLEAAWPVGIKEPNNGGSGSFILTQNVPNPFRGTSLVRIYMKNDGELNLSVYSNQGKKLSDYQGELNKGWHLFEISTLESQQMFLKVSEDKTTKTIKIISTGSNNDGERISYKGPSGSNSTSLKSFPDASGFIFYLGNQLQYTAYINGYHDRILLDNPASSQTYTFEMVPMVFTCGDSITISHVAGNVAPVEKTTIYGTVTNIPGEPSKCWITSNLGSDHQATAVNDATEASAGWYWQFNRKQGYKHDGTTRTPNTTWITSISDNSDWIASRDPCTLELGNGWRIPTKTEWTNVIISGYWTNWNGPWNSDLKIHAAGMLGDSNGSLYFRGIEGGYWSGTQYVTQMGWLLWFTSNLCSVGNNNKATGYSVRCIKE